MDILKRAAVFFLAMAIGSSTSAAPQARWLTPAGRIGIGWKDDLWKEKKWGWMSFVSFDRAGSRIATDGPTSDDDVSANLSIWSFPGGKLLKRLPGSPSAISSAWHYYATQRDIRSMANGAEVISAKDYVVQTFSPNEQFVAQANKDLGTRVVDLRSPHSLRKLGPHAAFALAVDPSSRRVAAGYWDSVGLWDVKSGVLKTVLHGIGRYVDGVAFSPNGKLLAVVTDLGGVQVWNIGRRRRLHTVSLPGGQVSIPAFSPNGRFLAVGVYGTGTVWLIDVRSGRVIDHQQVSDLGCGSAAFSPDGRYLITPSTGGLITWPHDNGGTTRIFRVHRPTAPHTRRREALRQWKSRDLGRMRTSRGWR